MPRTNQPTGNASVPAVPQQDALAILPDDLRRDLLAAQREQVSTFQRLPRVKIMGQGSGVFEFGATGDTKRDFTAIILNSHQRNVLWEPDSVRASDDAPPACRSNDGKIGVPRQGFAHVMLNGVAATGDERIQCSACRYNHWRSAGLIDPNPRNPNGKAVTNQRSLYLLVEGFDAPYELVLSPTSLKNYDQYLVTLAAQNIPVQALLTHFSQEVKGSGSNRYGVAKFANAGLLDGDTFNYVLQKRREYERHITPPDATEDYRIEDDEIPEPLADGEEAPF